MASKIWYLINYNQEQANIEAEIRSHFQPLYTATSSVQAQPLLGVAAETLLNHPLEPLNFSEAPFTSLRGP